MLDVICRSQRGRACNYGREGAALRTPLLLKTGAEGVTGVVLDGRGRTVRILGAEVSVDLPDGAYRDFLTDTDVPVANGRLTCGSAPLILAY